ncbi:MAG: hypothetical protein CL607_23100 [Anaerolineaceae bacterium]|nr:hypothetical protein [Anaerolineaceae bacterium]
MSARLSGFLGGFLILAAVVFLVGNFIFADSEWLTGFYGSFLCDSDETMTALRQNWSMPNGESGQNIIYLCEDQAGEQRNISDSMIPIMIVGFGGLLTVGILMTIGAASKASSTKSKNTFAYDSGTVNLIDMNNKDVKIKRGDLDPQTQDLLKQVLSSVTAATVHQTGPDDLSDRLQQLKDAYNKNLITKEEYDRVRQAILDSMDD